MTLGIAFISERTSPDRLPGGLFELGRLGPLRVVGAPRGPHFISRSVALVGWAFRRDNFAAYETLAAADEQAIIASEGQWALRHLWGHYLLFWIDEHGDGWILRSPAAGPAIYHAVEESLPSGTGRAVAFTDLRLARALGFDLDRPDAAALDAQIRFPLHRGRSTGIEGVSEILPGEIVRLHDGTRSKRGWSPWDHIRTPPVRIAADELREIVHDTIGAWSDRFERIQLELSGGLDSSIVAACLSGRKGSWRAANLATPGAPGDERPYARAMAERAGVLLDEIVMPDVPGDPLAALPVMRTRPGGFGLLGTSDAALLNAAEEFRADAIFTGVGGDNIFGLIRRPDPVVDAAHFAGLRTAWRTAADLAHMTRDSVWRAIYLAARRAIYGPRAWPRDGTFLARQFATVNPDHPWLEAAPMRHPGQFGYGRALLPIQPFVDGYDRAFALPMIAPLLSQPIVEFGLGVATWLWCEGGQDRALARRAFAEDLAPAVRDRRTKGRVESLIVPAFDANRAAIRRFLLDGWLADAGVLDCAAIDAELKRPADARDAIYIRLLQIVDIERWARSISGHPI